MVPDKGLVDMTLPVSLVEDLVWPGNLDYHIWISMNLENGSTSLLQLTTVRHEL